MARRRRSAGGEEQVVRALSLLMEMARSRRGVLLRPFAEKRGYSVRAVYRSRETLAKAGAPIRQNPESRSRWQLMDGWLPASLIGAEKDELMALFIARHIVPGLQGTPVARALDQLWARIANPKPQQSLPTPDMFPLSFRTLPAIDYSEHRHTIDQLQQAIDQRHAVHIRYRTPDAAITERTIEPGFLHWDGGIEAMYVPSWCRLRDAIRIFAVHRIQSIEPRQNEMARPVPRRTMERAFRLWYRDRVEHVAILFTARVAGEIRERRWHSTQRVLDARDGGTCLHMDISAPEELERWLLGFGPDARVIEPTRLAEHIQRAHASAAGIGQVIDAAEPRRVRSSTTGGVAPRARAQAHRSR